MRRVRESENEMISLEFALLLVAAFGLGYLCGKASKG
jgi:hypothetical protein